MATKYQIRVNNLTGAMGPNDAAYWNSIYGTTGAPYNLGAQPLYYNPKIGMYVTSADTGAAVGSVNFSDMGKNCDQGKNSFGRTSKKNRSGSKRCKAVTSSGKRCKCKLICSGKQCYCFHHRR
jgi:hypothetical protein